MPVSAFSFWVQCPIANARETVSQGHASKRHWSRRSPNAARPIPRPAIGKHPDGRRGTSVHCGARGFTVKPRLPLPANSRRASQWPCNSPDSRRCARAAVQRSFPFPDRRRFGNGNHSGFSRSRFFARSGLSRMRPNGNGPFGWNRFSRKVRSPFKAARAPFFGYHRNAAACGPSSWGRTT